MKRVFFRERNFVLSHYDRMHEKAILAFCLVVTLFIFVKIVLL
jgi:hypothetical protein